MKKLVRNFVDEAVASLASHAHSSDTSNSNSTSHYSSTTPQYGQNPSPYQGQHQQQSTTYGYPTPPVLPAQQTVSYNIPTSAPYFPPPPNAQTQVPQSYYSQPTPGTHLHQAPYTPVSPHQQQQQQFQPPNYLVQSIQPANATHTAVNLYSTYPPQTKPSQYLPASSDPAVPSHQAQYGAPTNHPGFSVPQQPIQPTASQPQQYQASHIASPSTPAPPLTPQINTTQGPPQPPVISSQDQRPISQIAPSPMPDQNHFSPPTPQASPYYATQPQAQEPTPPNAPAPNVSVQSPTNGSPQLPNGSQLPIELETPAPQRPVELAITTPQHQDQSQSQPTTSQTMPTLEQPSQNSPIPLSYVPPPAQQIPTNPVAQENHLPVNSIPLTTSIEGHNKQNYQAPGSFSNQQYSAPPPAPSTNPFAPENYALLNSTPQVTQIQNGDKQSTAAAAVVPAVIPAVVPTVAPPAVSAAVPAAIPAATPIPTPLNNQQYFPPPPSQSTNPFAQESQVPVTSTPQPSQQNIQAPTSPNNQPYFPPPPLHQYNPAAAPSGPYSEQSVASVSSMMSNLSVQNDTHTLSQSPLPPSFDTASVDNQPRDLPPIRAIGPPDEVVVGCPKAEPVNHSMYWHRLPDYPNYLICTRCFADHVKDSPFASQFERVEQPGHTKSHCSFWKPRMKELLWPQAVRSNDLNAIRAYVAKRSNIPLCSGPKPLEDVANGEWYRIAQPQQGALSKFFICGGCYEDHLCGNSFEARFSKCEMPSSSDKRICGLHIPYIRQLAFEMAKVNNWDGFISGAIRRLGLPICDGKEVPNTARTWFVPRPKLKKVRICEACYLDSIAFTLFEAEFEQYSPSSGFSGLKELALKSSCAMSRLSIIIALGMALLQRKFSVFRDAAEIIMPHVPCTADGIIGGSWFTLVGGCDGFNVCGTCYVGIVTTVGAADYFERADRPRDDLGMICSLCPCTQQNMQMMLKFIEMRDKGVFDIFEKHVRKWIDVTPCPGINPRPKGKWWGYVEAVACPECYHEFLAKTPLGDTGPCKNEYCENDNICQMWSPRMRKMWLEVCDAGPPGSPQSRAALEKFRLFGNHRMQVYKETIMVVEQMEMMKLARIQLGCVQMEAGAIEGSWAKQQQGQATIDQANNPEHYHRVAQLKIRWLQVE